MRRYTSPEGFHRHQCPDCGTVWEHRDKDHPAKAECTGPAAAHACPQATCVGRQTWVYDGPDAPDFTTNHQLGEST